MATPDIPFATQVVSCVIPNTGYDAVTLLIGSQSQPHGWNLLGRCRREASSFAALRSRILTIRGWAWKSPSTKFYKS